MPTVLMTLFRVLLTLFLTAREPPITHSCANSGATTIWT